MKFNFPTPLPLPGGSPPATHDDKGAGQVPRSPAPRRKNPVRGYPSLRLTKNTLVFFKVLGSRGGPQGNYLFLAYFSRASGTHERDIFSWVREGRGPGQHPGGHESAPDGLPPGRGRVVGKLNFTNRTFNERKELKPAPFCTEFRRGARPSSEIIQINEKMQVLCNSLSFEKYTKRLQGPKSRL